MKLKYNFVINTVAGQMVAVPVNCGNGEQSIIKLNETGAYIMELLKTDTDKQQIIETIKHDFEVADLAKLEDWIDNFLKKLKEADVLDYEH